MAEKLYYVKNVGCDATTYGLVRISDEDFPKFKSFIENLTHMLQRNDDIIFIHLKYPQNHLEVITNRLNFPLPKN